jgi:hypothetical protein
MLVRLKNYKHATPSHIKLRSVTATKPIFRGSENIAVTEKRGAEWWTPARTAGLLEASSRYGVLRARTATRNKQKCALLWALIVFFEAALEPQPIVDTFAACDASSLELTNEQRAALKPNASSGCSLNRENTAP